MDAFDNLLKEARRRAPRHLDFDGLLLAHQARNRRLVDEWLLDHPESLWAVLEIRIRASGHTKHRLRRYREMIQFNTRTPGLLVSRGTVKLDTLSFYTVESAAAAARAEVTDIDWRLMTVTEALNATP